MPEGWLALANSSKEEKVEGNELGPIPHCCVPSTKNR